MKHLAWRVSFSQVEQATVCRVWMRVSPSSAKMANWWSINTGKGVVGKMLCLGWRVWKYLKLWSSSAVEAVVLVALDSLTAFYIYKDVSLLIRKNIDLNIFCQCCWRMSVRSWIPSWSLCCFDRPLNRAVQCASVWETLPLNMFLTFASTSLPSYATLTTCLRLLSRYCRDTAVTTVLLFFSLL